MPAITVPGRTLLCLRFRKIYFGSVIFPLRSSSDFPTVISKRRNYELKNTNCNHDCKSVTSCCGRWPRVSSCPPQAELTAGFEWRVQNFEIHSEVAPRDNEVKKSRKPKHFHHWAWWNVNQKEILTWWVWWLRNVWLWQIDSKEIPSFFACGQIIVGLEHTCKEVTFISTFYAFPVLFNSWRQLLPAQRLYAPFLH